MCYTLDYNPVLGYSFCCSDHPSFGPWGLFHLAPVSLLPSSCCLLSTFLLSTTARCSRFISAIPPRSPGSFYWRVASGTKTGRWCTLDEFHDQTSWPVWHPWHTLYFVVVGYFLISHRTGLLKPYILVVSTWSLETRVLCLSPSSATHSASVSSSGKRIVIVLPRWLGGVGELVYGQYIE